MAVLDIKDVPDALYEALEARARAEGRSVAEEVIRLLQAAIETPPRRSILELEGLGKARWRNVDASVHVAAERDSWD